MNQLINYDIKKIIVISLLLSTSAFCQMKSNLRPEFCRKGKLLPKL